MGVFLIVYVIFFINSNLKTKHLKYSPKNMRITVVINAPNLYKITLNLSDQKLSKVITENEFRALEKKAYLKILVKDISRYLRCQSLMQS